MTECQDISQPEKQKRRLESVKTLLDVGLIMDSSHQSDPQEEKDSITSPNTLESNDRESKELLQKVPKRKRSKKSVIVESVPKVKKTTSNDKLSTCQENSQTIESSQTSVQESTSNERVSRLLWSSQPKEWFQKLWLPIETDSAVSPLNSLTGSFNCMESNSWFLMKQWKPQSKENWLKTLSPSLTFSIAESTVKESMTREKKVPKVRKTKGLKKSKKPVSNFSRKIRLNPNKEVASVLKQWFGCCRKTYNWALDAIKNQPQKDDKIPINLIELRKRFINADQIPNDMKYLKDCPKHVRDGAISDLVEAYSSNFKKRAKNPEHKFEIKFRSKKENQSIVIPCDALRWGEEESFKMYPTFLKNKIRFHCRLRDIQDGKKIDRVDYDCRLQVDKLGRFYLCIPLVKGYEGACESQTSSKTSWVALDPGVRTFQTLYSPEKGVAFKIGDGDMTRIVRLCKHLDKLISKTSQTKAYRKVKRYNKASFRLRERIKHLIDDVHWKAINFLLSRFQNILIPSFDVSRMVRKADRKIGKQSVRKMLTWRHYTFRKRLIEKSKFTNSNVYVIGEEYTSKTCGNCFQLHHKLGGKKQFHCPHCNVKIERDLNGGRNIFLKNVSL